MMRSIDVDDLSRSVQRKLTCHYTVVFVAMLGLDGWLSCVWLALVAGGASLDGKIWERVLTWVAEAAPFIRSFLCAEYQYVSPALCLNEVHLGVSPRAVGVSRANCINDCRAVVGGGAAGQSLSGQPPRIPASSTILLGDFRGGIFHERRAVRM